MQLHEVIQERFGDMDKAALRQIIREMGPCSAGIKWFDEEFSGDIEKAPIAWLSWFSQPFLCDADLREANLHKADLCGANLGNANLQNANLQKADLREADLRGADLHGADLRDADLYLAHYNRFTRFPDGFDPAAAGMVFD